MKFPTPRSVKSFVSLVFVMTLVLGLIYVVAQYNFRTNANDPQIQLAEDFASQLSSGRTVDSINTSNTVDMARSLSLFIFIYDDTGNVLAGTGKIDGELPILPVGVLDYTRGAGQDRITWQPQEEQRFALVVTRYDGPIQGFVAVGRSLREVEQRVSTLGWYILGAWLLGVIGLYGLEVSGKIADPKDPKEQVKT